VNSISVVAVQCSDDHTSASIFGLASVNGSGAFEYEIDVADAGEPGRNDTYRISIPGASYDSGQHFLLGGNIQIR
jgi:hypothetical protein